MGKSISKITNPRLILLIYQILGLILLVSRDYGDQNPKLIISMVVLMSLIYGANLVLSRVSKGDNYIFLIVSMLLTVSSMIIYRLDPAMGVKQLAFIFLGIIVFFITYLFFKRMKFLQDITSVYLIMSYILFFLTFLLGSKNRGAINWIKLGPIGFQPAEITKLLFLFFLASYYGAKEKNRYGKYSSYIVLLINYSFMGLLFLQTDLGMALIFFSIFTVVQFIYEEDRKAIYANVAMFSLAGLLGYLKFNHVKVRFKAWLNPWKYIDNEGYQITQSLFAIAAGGFFGTGVGLGKPNFIAEVHTDFIFSAIAEEMGILTGIAVIILYVLLAYRGFKISIWQKDKFYRILALGVSSLFAIQAFIIIGGVIKLIPLTGITLPFISYGGSSLVTSFIALGVLQSCSEEKDMWGREDE